MTQKAHDISALLGSRICHDLISPLGAIGNGLELLSMTGASSQEMTLIAESVANANARVKFYRVAYGALSIDQSMSRNEIVSILDDITRGTRLRYVWNPTVPVARRDVKLVFLLLQCFENAMPYGGEVVVSLADNVWRVHGIATKLKVNAELWEILSRPETAINLTPAQVQFALVPEMLTATGRRLTLQIRDHDIMASF